MHHAGGEATRRQARRAVPGSTGTTPSSRADIRSANNIGQTPYGARAEAFVNLGAVVLPCTLERPPGGVAQWIEQEPSKLKVGGSIPPAPASHIPLCYAVSPSARPGADDAPNQLSTY